MTSAGAKHPPGLLPPRKRVQSRENSLASRVCQTGVAVRASVRLGANENKHGLNAAQVNLRLSSSLICF